MYCDLERSFFRFGKTFRIAGRCRRVFRSSLAHCSFLVTSCYEVFVSHISLEIFDCSMKMRKCKTLSSKGSLELTTIDTRIHSFKHEDWTPMYSCSFGLAYVT